MDQWLWMDGIVADFVSIGCISDKGGRYEWARLHIDAVSDLWGRDILEAIAKAHIRGEPLHIEITTDIMRK